MKTNYAPKSPISWLLTFLLSLCALGLIISLASCSSTKDLTKKQSESKTETETKSVETRTITETAKDSVKVGPDSLEADVDFNTLKFDPVTFEDDVLRVDINRDPVTNKVKIKAKKKEQTIPVNINRTTVEKKYVDTKTKSETKEREKDKHKKTEGINLNYLWWLLLLLLIPIWRYLRNP